HKNVFFTKGKKIILSLPTNFFENTNRTDEALTESNEDAEYIFDYFQALNEFNRDENEKIISIGIKTNKIAPGKATVKGQVREAENGQPVIGATIILEEPFVGAATDEFGNYSITL